MNQISNNSIRQILFLLLILLLTVILFLQLQTFIPALLGAYTLYVILRKYMFILVSRYKWRKALAATTLMLLSFVIILMPFLLLINMLGSRISFAIQHSSQVLTSIESFIHKYEVRYNIDILSAENINKISAWAANTLPSVLGATLSTITTLLVMYFVLYFMLTEGRKMEASFYDLVPFKDENALTLRKETNALVYSNALGIPLIALLFFADNSPTKGIIMLIYGFGIIGTVDNVFRFWLQKKLGDVHPLITVFGVIIGINLFGFMGLIFGPILISLFILLIRIYSNEFSVKRPAQ
jgi:predicted PurR-regulated permease PerM